MSISAAYSKDFFRRQYIPQEFANAALAGQSRDNHLIKRDFTSRDLLVSAKQLTCRSGGSLFQKRKFLSISAQKKLLKNPPHCINAARP